LPVSAWRCAASTRPACRGMCCSADVSQIHTPTHSPSSECVGVRRLCDPYETREAGIPSFKGRTHSRDDNSSSGTPRARLNSRVLGEVCTSVHIRIVDASRVGKVEKVNQAVQAVQMVQEVHPSKAAHRRGFPVCSCLSRDVRRVWTLEFALKLSNGAGSRSHR